MLFCVIMIILGVVNAAYGFCHFGSVVGLTHIVIGSTGFIMAGQVIYGEKG